MGLISITNYTSGASITAAGQNSNENTIVNEINGNLTTANIHPNAGIVDTQLAQITTASKVSGAAITLLTSVPSGAGALPLANAPYHVPMSLSRGLKVVRTNVTTVTVTADELVLQDTNGYSYRIQTVSEAIAITTAGASGLDAGAEAANTIYYIWIMRKSSDGTVNGLLSVEYSAASVTFPAGYDQWAIVSCVGNNNTSDFIDFTQEGNRYDFITSGAMASGSTVSATTSIDLTPDDMSTNPAFVPSALSTITFGTLFSGGTASNIGIANYNVAANLATASSDNAGAIVNGATYAVVYWQLRVVTADILYWASDNAAAKVYIQGFTINKLPLG